jgi:hypothetical protein
VMKTSFFWVVVLCGPVGRHHGFGETYCLFSREDGDSMLLRKTRISTSSSSVDMLTKYLTY